VDVRVNAKCRKSTGLKGVVFMALIKEEVYRLIRYLVAHGARAIVWITESKGQET